MTAPVVKLPKLWEMLLVSVVRLVGDIESMQDDDPDDCDEGDEGTYFGPFSRGWDDTLSPDWSYILGSRYGVSWPNLTSTCGDVRRVLDMIEGVS